MPRIAVISDIHANIRALDAVLADIDTLHCDSVLCAGDLVGYGPRPREVIAVMRARDIACVMGNYDEAIGFRLPSCGCHIDNPEQKRLSLHALRWTADKVSAEDRLFLRGLPEQLLLEASGQRIYVTHATPDSIKDYVYGCDDEKIEQMLQDVDENIYIYGHTHYPYTRRHGQHFILNPGSVGRPKQGDSRASYALLELEGDRVQVSHRKVVYDVEAVAQDMLALGIDPFFADFLRHGGAPDRLNCKLGDGCGCDA